MGQVISQAYYKAKVTSTPSPPGCNGDSDPVAVGSIYLCLRQGYCTQTQAGQQSYCLAFPFTVTNFKINPTEPIYVVETKTKNQNENFFDLLIPKAHAVPPSPWLPDVDAMTPPTLTIVLPTCNTTTGNDRECIRCNTPNKNADCLKVKICTNGTPTCNSAADFIEPIFAIQTSYN